MYLSDPNAMRGVPYRNDQRAGGFTLLEIIIVLAILAVVLGFSVGWVVNRQGQEVEAAYSDVDATLRHARGGTMEAHGPWVITFSATSIQAVPAKPVGGDQRFQARAVSWDDGTLLEVFDDQMGEFRVPEDPIQLVVTHRAFLPAMQLRVRNEGRWVSGVIDPVSGALTTTGADN